MNANQEYATSFRQLANIVTGFAVTEALVVMLNIANGGTFGANIVIFKLLAASLAFLFHLLFGTAVWRCYAAETTLLLLAEGDHAAILR